MSTICFRGKARPRLHIGAQAVMAVGIAAHALGFALGGTMLVCLVSMSIMLLLAVMAVYAVCVLVRAVRRQRDGALVLLMGLGSFLVISFAYALSSYDLLPRDPFVGTDLAGFSAIIMLFSNIIVVAERWSVSISAAERLNDDLRELLDVSLAITSEIDLDTLLAKIVSGTTRVLRADRSTLFIHDGRTNELYTMAAEGISTREIRMRPDMGLAGQSFTTGETINVPDAYTDPRFNRAMDRQTGYRSRNILSMPSPPATGGGSG